MPELPPGYTLRHGTPPVAEYLQLRKAAGMTPHDEAAAKAGLPNTLIGVLIEHDGEIVGMGRVVGDGGLFYQVVDIAVRPDHQGRGLGKAVISALMERLVAAASARAYVSLIADGDARHLYARYGFETVAPASIGMARWLDPEQ